MTHGSSVAYLRRDLGQAIPPPCWVSGIGLAPFTPDDAGSVHALLTLGYARGGGDVAPYRRWWSALSTDSEYDPALCFRVVDGPGRVVAVAQCWTSGFIKDLVVHPDHRRQGVGTALLRHVFIHFRDAGFAHVDLKVHRDNPSGAMGLYRSLGMVEIVDAA